MPTQYPIELGILFLLTQAAAFVALSIILAIILTAADWWNNNVGR